jgi:hypothetical protein
LGPFGANVVIDHVSMSWGVDENFSTWYGGAQNITLSNSIVSEGVASAGEPGKGLLLGDSTRNLAVIGNLIANNQDRSPYWKGYSTGVQVNNLIYNWGGNQASYTADPEGSGPAQVSIVGNRFVRGPSTPSGSPIQIYSSSATGTKVYVADNADGRTASPPSDPWSLVYNQEGSGAVATFAPVWPNGFTAASVPSVSAVTSKAGACPNWRDAVDTRIVDEVTNGTGSATSFTMIWPSLSQGTTSHSVPSNPHGDDDTTAIRTWKSGCTASTRRAGATDHYDGRGTWRNGLLRSLDQPYLHAPLSGFERVGTNRRTMGSRSRPLGRTPRTQNHRPANEHALPRGRPGGTLRGTQSHLQQARCVCTDQRRKPYLELDEVFTDGNDPVTVAERVVCDTCDGVVVPWHRVL